MVEMALDPQAFPRLTAPRILHKTAWGRTPAPALQDLLTAQAMRGPHIADLTFPRLTAPHILKKTGWGLTSAPATS